MSTPVPVVEETYERLRGTRLAARVRRDVDLTPFTTYRVGGPALVMVEVNQVRDLDEVAAVVGVTEIPVFVLGRGSNLLVADRGLDSLVVVLGSEMATIEMAGDIVSVGGAALLPVVARTTARAGLTGFEWAVGVPGSIGGAVKMNAGGHGSDMAASLVDADVYDLRTGRDERRPVSGLQLAYRRSSIGRDEVVHRARLRLAPGDAEASVAELAAIVKWRRENQPGGQNAGSVFTNPESDSAGRLIEAAGGKGLRVGSAEISTKHANFIQSDEGGLASDVLALMVEVRRLVREVHGVDLVPETRVVGFTPSELEGLYPEERP